MIKNFLLLLSLLPSILQEVMKLLNLLEDLKYKEKKRKAKELIKNGFKDESSKNVNDAFNL